MSKLTTEEFIENAKKVHGDKYDYSLVEYIKNNIKVKIICSIHGIFEQQPNNHNHGQGCPKCGLITTGYKCRTKKEDFIKKSKIVHGNKYDYSLLEYKNNKTKIKIICPEHGIFEQYPQHHTRGRGCYKCNGGHQLETSDFIDRSNKIHDYIYDYSKTIYTKAKGKVIIICPEHGEFKQNAFSHTKGAGCPKCNGGSDSEYEINGRYLYLFKDLDYDLIKIGISHNPEQRLNRIKETNNLIILKKYKNCSLLEKKIHKKYEKYRTRHTSCEDGKTEWFNLSETQISNIDKYIKSQI